MIPPSFIIRFALNSLVHISCRVDMYSVVIRKNKMGFIDFLKTDSTFSTVLFVRSPIRMIGERSLFVCLPDGLTVSCYGDIYI